MNFKTFFKDKKNLAITILSVLLIASFSSKVTKVKNYPKQRIRLNSLAKMSNKPNQT